MPSWSRPHFVPGGGDAQVVLAVFTDTPVTGLTVSRSRHGVPDDAASIPARMDDLTRDQAPHLFNELDDAALLALASDEGLPTERLAASTRQVCIVITVPDPEDCLYLQLAWGFARALCDAVQVHGVLDRHARRWWSSERLLAGSNLGLDPQRELSTLLLVDPDPRFGHVCHTRGLRKFGRPDLILPGLSVQHGSMAADVLHAIARPLVFGAALHPDQRVQQGWFSGTVQAYVPGRNAPPIDLDNHGLVLVPDAG